MFIDRLSIEYLSGSAKSYQFTVYIHMNLLNWVLCKSNFDKLKTPNSIIYSFLKTFIFIVYITHSDTAKLRYWELL